MSMVSLSRQRSFYTILIPHGELAGRVQARSMGCISLLSRDAIPLAFKLGDLTEGVCR